jgi:hypothetical protein
MGWSGTGFAINSPDVGVSVGVAVSADFGVTVTAPSSSVGSGRDVAVPSGVAVWVRLGSNVSLGSGDGSGVEVIMSTGVSEGPGVWVKRTGVTNDVSSGSGVRVTLYSGVTVIYVIGVGLGVVVGVGVFVGCPMPSVGVADNMTLESTVGVGGKGIHSPTGPYVPVSELFPPCAWLLLDDVAKTAANRIASTGKPTRRLIQAFGDFMRRSV